MMIRTNTMTIIHPADHYNLRPLSQGSARFRDSVHLIPTPGVESQRPERCEPNLLKWWIIEGLSFFMVGLAFCLEVILWLSFKYQGFHVPTANAFAFASTQFLTSFFPSLLMTPLAALWASNDEMLRWYHPYTTLARGHATAEESLLLDYVQPVFYSALKIAADTAASQQIVLNKLTTLLRSFKLKHWLIHVSAVTTLATMLLNPLAGSVFEVKQTPAAQLARVTITRSLGLAPDVNNLNAFVASAGFAEAAVFNNLQDPPFVQGGWSTAAFTFPSSSGLNGTMVVSTVAVQTNINCALPYSYALDTPGTGNYTIQSTSDSGCSYVVNINPSDSEKQYGVVPIANCGPATGVDFQPIMFWYFQTAGIQGQAEARCVFCQPQIKIYNVKATANLNDGSLVNVTILGDYVPPNNVTGDPLNGQAYNGVVFDTTSADRFVQARATAIKSAIPGAIFRFATQRSGGLQATFDDPNGFLNITNHVYRQHLALVAKSIYFIPDDTTLIADMTSLLPRLWVDPLPAHSLAIILLIIGFSGLYIHTTYRRNRRHLYLTSPPGTIASIVALTSRSGFGELLLPYDDKATMERKLAGLRFRLDGRTGAILAEDDWNPKYYRAGVGAGDDAKMLLLGSEPQTSPGYPHPSWGQYKTPYDS